jgi:hypothetical protein
LSEAELAAGRVYDDEVMTRMVERGALAGSSCNKMRWVERDLVRLRKVVHDATGSNVVKMHGGEKSVNREQLRKKP